MPRGKVDRTQLIELLPQYDNETLAQRFSVTPERIRQLRASLGGEPQARASRTTEYSYVTGTAEFQEALGKDTDAETAIRFNVPVNVVHHARVKAKIPSFASSRRNEMIPLLGTMPDKDIATKYGYSLNGVITLRERLKIAAPENNGTVGKRKGRRAMEQAVTAIAATAPVAKPAKDVELPTQTVSDEILNFLRTRHKVGDSTEALAARLEMSEAEVKAALGIN